MDLAGSVAFMAQVRELINYRGYEFVSRMCACLCCIACGVHHYIYIMGRSSVVVCGFSVKLRGTRGTMVALEVH